MFALNSLFWLEILLILLVVAFVARRSGSWKRPLFWLAALLFLVAMNPWLDTLARHSIWLHSWQSVVVHHLVPILWLAAFMEASIPAGSHTRDSNSQEDGQWQSLLFWFGLGIAGVLAWGGMLPVLHQPLMDSPLFYAMGKWTMALGGLWLCSSPQRVQQHSHTVCLVMLLPLVGLGLAMLLSPLLYRMTTAVTEYPGGSLVVELLPLSLPSIVDQWLGGVILLSGALSYWLMNRMLQRPSVQASPVEAADGVRQSLRCLRPDRVSLGVSPNRRRYS
ncbi:hypothetical protein [Candidatus Thalassolituus haligoni]|uniref:hypothetical protein n=1 Tax=Candidatus Thalassolituus haligoni TaxID=3100113 RepID=UPI003512FE1B